MLNNNSQNSLTVSCALILTSLVPACTGMASIILKFTVYSQSLGETDFCFIKKGEGPPFWIGFYIRSELHLTKHPCKCGWTQRKPDHFFLLEISLERRQDPNMAPMAMLQYTDTQMHNSSCPLSLKIGHRLCF